MEIAAVSNTSSVRDAAAQPQVQERAIAAPGARFELPDMSVSSDPLSAASVASQSPAKAFEALMISQLVDIMLPESDAVFGEGAGSSVWRSMFVDVLSTQLADDIDLGVADRIEGAFKAHDPNKGSV